jgi:hypothetical protein
MKNYFLVKNLFQYEKVIAPPENLPKNLKSVYVTDTDENCLLANKLGWDIVKKTEMFKEIVDKFERRKCIAFINSYPLNIVPEINDADFVFICDSNIIRLWDKYEEFVKNCNIQHALFITSGYYSGLRDNIISECDVSCTVSRWSYNHDKIRSCTVKYVNELTKNKINIETLSVVSAKYIGWNVKHRDYAALSNTLYDEYCENLQGNIILTYISGIYPDKVFNYHNEDYTGSSLNSHNFEA